MTSEGSVLARVLALGRPTLAGGALAALAAATAGAIFASQGHPLVSLAPLLAVTTVALVVAIPPRATVSVVILLVFLAEATETVSIPDGPVWHYPLAPLSRVLFEKLDKLAGLKGLYLNVVETFLAAMAIILAIRRRSHRLREEDPPAARCLVDAEVVGLAAIAAFEAWGLVRGGDFKGSLYQIRQLLYLPLLALIVQGAFGAVRHLELLWRTVVGAAVVKSAIAAYAWFTVFQPAGARPNFITAHADSGLFSVAVIILVGSWLERRTARSRAALLALGPVLLLGMHVNGRRLAWIQLAAGLLLMFALSPSTPRKRAVQRLALAAVPVVLLYFAAGWGSSAGVFSPVRAVRGIVDGNVDPSTQSRERENYNLVFTFSQRLAVGSGFGHPYEELIHADDLSNFFQYWRFIPHNSLLGLWAFTGLLGFTLITLPLLTALFLAFRANRLAVEPRHRVALVASMAGVFGFVLQAWGDMGLQSTGCVFVAGLGMAAIGKVATAIGAWPVGHTNAGRGSPRAAAGGSAMLTPGEPT